MVRDIMVGQDKDVRPNNASLVGMGSSSQSVNVKNTNFPRPSHKVVKVIDYAMKDQLSPSRRSGVCKFVKWENRKMGGTKLTPMVHVKVMMLQLQQVGDIGRCSIVEPKLWDALDGLKLAWDIGLRHIILEIDSLIAT
ncbi:hypothetical protein GOBAR_AA32041 [Gossypium barbadense]|uniref:RNase H type-1 domain-containing protein n=1 Tax=Gossypium barbadense TaxID=3634 RepID=A0A2P5WC19_GOSBA|nr:hypothetical protein GOBAR_AA32041 [Gossypium barbadense]